MDLVFSVFAFETIFSFSLCVCVCVEDERNFVLVSRNKWVVNVLGVVSRFTMLLYIIHSTSKSSTNKLIQMLTSGQKTCDWDFYFLTNLGH